MEFKEFPKIPRLSRDCTITEKIDGTNACVVIEDERLNPTGERLDVVNGLVIMAQSRTRFITPTSDNFGFAKWVVENSDKLARLGPGYHYGEWWGAGIQRGYGLKHKVFSLFNPDKMGAFKDDPDPNKDIQAVPVLYRGPFDTKVVEDVLAKLKETGSQAAPGFMNPEGIIIYHHASHEMFKKTFDDGPKERG